MRKRRRVGWWEENRQSQKDGVQLRTRSLTKKKKRKKPVCKIVALGKKTKQTCTHTSRRVLPDIPGSTHANWSADQPSPIRKSQHGQIDRCCNYLTAAGVGASAHSSNP